MQTARDELLDRFLSHLADRSTPPPTLNARRLDLQGLIRWYEAARGRPFRLVEICANDICRWMASGNAKASTANRRRSSIRAWTAWAIANGYLRDDPTLGVETLDLPQPELRSVSMDALDAILREARKDPDPRLARRNELLITLLIHTGIRVAELCALTVNDVNLRARLLHIRHGKGDRPRVAYLNAETTRLLERYLVEVRFGDMTVPSPGDPRIIESLWFHRRGHHTAPGIVARSVQELLNRLTKAASDLAMEDASRVRRRDEREALLFLAAEINGITPHTFRHSLARRMIERGVDLSAVQAALGHASVTTTSRYTQPGEQALRRAFEMGAETT